MIINLSRYRKNNRFFYRLSSAYFCKHDLTHAGVKKELARFFGDNIFCSVSFRSLNKFLKSYCTEKRFNAIWQVEFIKR